MKKSCEYCDWRKDEGGAMCLAKSPKKGWLCTRDKGHPWPHAACGDGEDHETEIWFDDS